jgi:hypothetical protein
MTREEYLTIAKNAAQVALNVMPDSLHYDKIQKMFNEYKLDNLSRPVVQLLMKIGKDIYYSQATESERESMKRFRQESVWNKKDELQKQKEIRKISKKLKIIDQKRKRDGNNPYPHSKYDYGSIMEEYDPLTGKKRKAWIPNLTPGY